MNTNERIFELFDYIDENSLENEGSIKEHLDYVDSEWDGLPDDKLNDPDRTLLALPIIDITLNIKDFSLAQKWIDIYLFDENEKSVISLYKGKLEFEKGNLEEAHKLFNIAFRESSGRQMEGEGKYLDFYLHPEKYRKE